MSSAVDKSDQSHFGPGDADTTVAVVRRSVGDSMAVRAIHGTASALARTPQSDGTHLSRNNPGAGVQPISRSGVRPIQERHDVLHRARDVLFLFPHRRYVVHSTPGSLEPREPGNDPAGNILRR